MWMYLFILFRLGSGQILRHVGKGRRYSKEVSILYCMKAYIRHKIDHVFNFTVFRFVKQELIWAASWQNQQNDCSLRSAWASAQSDQSLRCALVGWLRTQSVFIRTAKTLIRLGECPGWSESLLGAHAILLVLSWGGWYADICDKKQIDDVKMKFGLITLR